MDETPLWMDMPGDTTVERQGTKSVPVRHEKLRFTVVLAARASGKKLKPFVVFKGIRVVAELNSVPGVVVALSSNGWMNEKLTIDWVKRVWGTLSFEKRLPVWDAYRCHMMDNVKHKVNRITKTDISLCMIPAVEKTVLVSNHGSTFSVHERARISPESVSL